MNTILFAHISEGVSLEPSVYRSGWVAIPLFITILLVLYCIARYLLHFNIVHLIISFFVVCFIVGFLSSAAIPALSIVAVTLGILSALFFVLTTLKM